MSFWLMSSCLIEPVLWSSWSFWSGVSLGRVVGLLVFGGDFLLLEWLFLKMIIFYFNN